MSKEIQLSKGMLAVVDDEDYQMLMGLGLRWCINDGYAFNSALGRMHRFLLKAPVGKMVDHINGDKLDNRRANLRFATNSENQANRKVARGVSVFKGVTWQKRTYADGKGFWKAQIVVGGEVIYLGSFPTDLDAARAYNDAAHKHFGEYASINDLNLSPSTLISSERLQTKKSSPSGFKGVTFDKARGKWAARLVRKGVCYLQKRFSTAEEAARAYDEVSKNVYGTHAVTNF